MDSSWSDQEILDELGRRLRRERLNRNITQHELAARAGVSRGSVAKIESGTNTSLATLVKLMRALGVMSQLDRVLPIPEVSPSQPMAPPREERKRATGRRGHARR